MQDDDERVREAEKKLRDLEEMRKKEQKDVADLMRMKKKVMEEIEIERKKQEEDRKRLSDEEDKRWVMERCMKSSFIVSLYLSTLSSSSFSVCFSNT